MNIPNGACIAQVERRATRPLRRRGRRRQPARRLSRQPARHPGSRSRSALPALRRRLTEQPNLEPAANPGAEKSDTHCARWTTRGRLAVGRMQSRVSGTALGLARRARTGAEPCSRIRRRGEHPSGRHRRGSVGTPTSPMQRRAKASRRRECKAAGRRSTAESRSTVAVHKRVSYRHVRRVG
jgi:hypothetical protein